MAAFKSSEKVFFGSSDSPGLSVIEGERADHIINRLYVKYTVRSPILIK